jgi:ABC-2 type transport system permease protein
MMNPIYHTWYVTVRLLRALWRQPWMIGVTLVQPVVWLILFGELFKRVVEIPGFESGGSYVDFLAPGVIVMSALFSNGWSGMSLVEDIEGGILDRLLVSPVYRGAIIAGSLVYQGIITLVQSLIIIGLAWLMGASFSGGLAGLAVLLLGAMLLGGFFASFSNAMGLLTRRGETLVVLVNFIVLPATFLSTAFMPAHLTADWIATVAQYNPVTWVLEAARELLAGGGDWTVVLSRLGLLAALAVISAGLATRAFRVYQRSL